MKNASCIGVVVMFCFLMACDNGEGTPQVRALLTVNLNANFMESAKDKWILATSETGEILDVKRLTEATTSQMLETTRPVSTFDLTIISVYDVPSAYTFYSIETFKGVPAAETFTLGKITGTPATLAGNAAITITNYSESLDPRSNIKFSTKPYGAAGVFSANYSGTTYSVNTPLYQGFNKVQVYGLRADVPVYKMISNVNAGDAVSVDFNAFEPFQNFVPLNSFYGFAYVIGIEADDSHFELVVSDKSSSADPRKLYIGSVPGFPRYLTYVYSFSGFEFLKVGGPVASFVAPVYNTSVTNNTLSGFKASINTDHDYKLAQWRENAGLHRATWIVHSDKNTHPNIDFDFPQQLTTAYPNLTKDGLVLSNGSFIRSAGTYTYLDMLADRFKNVRKTEYEMYTMAFN